MGPGQVKYCRQFTGVGVNASSGRPLELTMLIYSYCEPGVNEITCWK